MSTTIAAELVGRGASSRRLVHAAVTSGSGPLEQVELDAWRQIQAVNVESALLPTQAFVARMQERHRSLAPDDTAAAVAMLATKPKTSPARRSPPIAAWSCAGAMTDETLTGRPVLIVTRTVRSPNLASPGRFCKLDGWERN